VFNKKSPQQPQTTAELIAYFIKKAGPIQSAEDLHAVVRIGLEEWTKRRRVIDGRPFNLDRYPFLRDIYADESPVMVLSKAAQMGLSEYAINKSLWGLDIHNMDILYLLPTDDESYDFSNSRFGPAIEGSDYLESLFTDVSNTQHKRAGERNFFIRGSRSKSKLKSMPIDFLIVDEFDEMVQKHLPLARRRLDASPWKWELDISTPTVPEFGIHARWLESDQHEFMVVCPACGLQQIPTWPDNINLEVVPANYWCAKCHKPTTTFMAWNGLWVPQNPSGEIRGRRVSQLLSPTKTAQEMATEAKAADDDPAAEQEFWNQGIGLPHVAKGGALDDDLLLACRDPEYREMPSVGKRCSMGVDVGKALHVRISMRYKDEKRAVYIGTVLDFEDLVSLMTRYDVRCAVIDKNPETRKVVEFCERFPGRAWAAQYDIEDKAETARWDGDKRIVHLNRTVAMDKMMARVQGQHLILPAHAQTIEGYFTQMKAPKRILSTDKRTGQPVYRYVEGTKADHFAHAELYDEMAFERTGKAPSHDGMTLNLQAGHRSSPWKV